MHLSHNPEYITVLFILLLGMEMYFHFKSEEWLKHHLVCDTSSEKKKKKHQPDVSTAQPLLLSSLV